MANGKRRRRSTNKKGCYLVKGVSTRFHGAPEGDKTRPLLKADLRERQVEALQTT